MGIEGLRGGIAAALWTSATPGVVARVEMMSSRTKTSTAAHEVMMVMTQSVTEVAATLEPKEGKGEKGEVELNEVDKVE